MCNQYHFFDKFVYEELHKAIYKHIQVLTTSNYHNNQ